MDTSPFTWEYDAGSATLAVTGSLDEPHSDALREAIREHSQDFTADLTIDLSEVAYLPSVGVGVLAIATRRARENDHRVDLRAPADSIAHRILTLGGLPHTTT